MQCLANVGADVQDLGPGGGRIPDFWDVIQRCRAGNIFFGSDTWGLPHLDQLNFGGFTLQVGLEVGGDVAAI